MELRGERNLYMAAQMTLSSRFLALLSSPRAIPVLFLLYLIPRAALLGLAVAPTSDAAWYFHRAVAWTHGMGYSEGGVLTAFWPPGWPLALTTLFTLFGVHILAAQLFNLVCALATAWFTLDLGRRLFRSELAGRAALLLLAIYPNSIGYVPLLLTEVFYTTLLLAGCWLLVVNRSLKTLLLAGVVFGLATLVKAQSMVVIPLIFSIALLREFNRGNALRAFINAAIVIIVAFIVVSPWSYRNYQVFGRFVMISTNGGLTFLTGNNPTANGDYTPEDAWVTSIPRTVATQLWVDAEAKRRAKLWISQNPGRFLELMPLKVYRLWAPDGEAEWGFQAGYKGYGETETLFRVVRYLNQAYYLLLMIGFLVAAWVLFSGKAKISGNRFDWWLLPYAVALYPTLIALVFSGQSRFHYPVMPFVTMSCGWLLTWWALRGQPESGLEHGKLA